MHFRPVPIAALVCGPSDSHLAYETVVSCSHLSSASVINFIANLVLKGGIYKLHNSLLDSNFFPYSAGFTVLCDHLSPPT